MKDNKKGAELADGSLERVGGGYKITVDISDTKLANQMSYIEIIENEQDNRSKRENDK